MRKLMLVVSVAVLSACKPAPSTSQPGVPAPATSQAPAPRAPAPEAPAPAVPAGDADAAAAPAFAGKVWRVQSSTAGEPGSTYAFVSDGTLVIDSPNGTPMHGRWSYDGGKLVLTEEGIAYPTDILKLDAATLQIRSHNPGGTVDITLVPAPDVAMPATK